MIRLIITMCVLTSRKTTGQFIPQFASATAEPTLTQQPPRQVNVQLVPPLPRRFQNPRPTGQLLRANGSDGNLPPREFPPRRELFIPRTALLEDNRNATNQPQVHITTESTTGYITARNRSSVNDTVDFKPRPDFDRGELNVTNSRTPATSWPATLTPKPALPRLPKNNTTDFRQPNENAEVVTPSLDQRANFDGDKCPTGTIRINGSTECVQPD